MLKIKDKLFIFLSWISFIGILTSIYFIFSLKKESEEFKSFQYYILFALILILIIEIIQYQNREKIISRLRQSTQVQITLQNLLGKLEAQKIFLETEVISCKNKIAENNSDIQIGKLISNIAHELKGPLTYIEGNIDYIRESFLPAISSITTEDANICDNFLELTEQMDKMLLSSLKGCKHIKNLCENLCKTSRPTETTLLNIKDVIDTAVEITQIKWKYLFKSLEINNLTQKDLFVKGSETQLIQVFSNLIINSCDSISEKSRTQEKDSFKGFVKIIISEKENSGVHISIIDNGTGIPNYILSKLGKETITTKESGKGTGLGLKIVHDIIFAHRGIININSSSENGTEINITLPQKNQIS